jgi:cytochrome c oxidase subunit 1
MVSIVLGILMRLNQSGVINQSPVTFYSHLTTHGLTMIAIWLVAGMAAVNYLLQRYVQVNYSANIFAMVFTVIGVGLFWTSTFIGKFHSGWTFLYPLPLHIAWAEWATPLFLSSLVVLGVGWLVWCVSMMIQLVRKYPLPVAMAWQHFKKNPPVETPPFILISMITFIGIITCLPRR